MIVYVCSFEALAGPGNIPSPAQRELRLIQSKADIENPTIVVEALPLSLGMKTLFFLLKTVMMTTTSITTKIVYGMMMTVIRLRPKKFTKGEKKRLKYTMNGLTKLAVSHKFVLSNN